MTNIETLAAIQQELQALEQISFVAHRDATEAMPVIEPYGAETLLSWLNACKLLFLHDRDAGKAFIRGSVKAANASGEVLPWMEQALKFTQWRGSWKALDGFMEHIARAYELLGKEGEARWVNLGLIWCERHLDSGATYFRVPVEELAGDAGIAGIETLLEPAEELFTSRRLALGTYLGGAIRVRNLLGVEAVLPWAKRGADILQAGRVRGEAFFKLESEESIAILLENLPGFRIAEHQRLLQLLLVAWYGEPFDLQESNWSPDKGRAFVETDGATLFLPVAMPSRHDAVLGLLHTAGHLTFHSYERRYIEALFQQAGMAHPPLDEDQRITWRPLFAAYGEDMIRFQLIFDLCEDLRVDSRIQRVIPNYLTRMIGIAEQHPMPEGAAGEYYQLALQSLHVAKQAMAHPEQALLIRHDEALTPFGLSLSKPVRPSTSSGRTGFKLHLAVSIDNDRLMQQLLPLLEQSATVVDAFNIANAIYQETTLPAISLEDRQHAFLPGRSPNAARPVYPRNELDRAELGTGQLDKDDIVDKQDIRPNPEQRDIPKAAQGDDPDFDIPPEETKGTGGRVGVGIPQPAKVYGYARGPGYSEKGFPYQEWDYRDGRYKRNWAWIQEKELQESDHSEAVRLLEQYAPALKRLKRAIQSQKPARMAPLRRQFDGDELDLEAAISYIAEKRAGMSPKANIYRQRVMKHRDTAVILLADLSTSIMAKLPDGNGRVVDSIRAGLLLFAESMEEVGDLYAIDGFASKYRDNVSYYPIKAFDQRMSGAIRATIGGLSGRLATRMGTAIRHAVKRFDNAPSQRRLLLILSDGRPADYDDGGDERYLHEDTRMAVKEAVDAGVHPFCITLDPSGSKYLPQIFGPGHYLVLDHINDLPKKLPEVYLRLRR